MAWKTERKKERKVIKLRPLGNKTISRRMRWHLILKMKSEQKNAHGSSASHEVK